jgi:hypothetical protein
MKSINGTNGHFFVVHVVSARVDSILVNVVAVWPNAAIITTQRERERRSIRQFLLEEWFGPGNSQRLRLLGVP